MLILSQATSTKLCPCVQYDHQLSTIQVGLKRYAETQWCHSFSQVSSSIHIPTFKKRCRESWFATACCNKQPLVGISNRSWFATARGSQPLVVHNCSLELATAHASQLLMVQQVVVNCNKWLQTTSVCCHSSW